jgi:hypothetical protein
MAKRKRSDYHSDDSNDSYEHIRKKSSYYSKPIISKIDKDIRAIKVAIHQIHNMLETLLCNKRISDVVVVPTPSLPTPSLSTLSLPSLLQSSQQQHPLLNSHINCTYIT